jgi:hypothetical protein
MFQRLSEYAKFVAALLGAFVVAFAGLLPVGVAPWVQAVAAFLSAVAVFAVPNARVGAHRADDQ